MLYVTIGRFNYALVSDYTAIIDPNFLTALRVKYLLAGENNHKKQILIKISLQNFYSVKLILAEMGQTNSTILNIVMPSFPFVKPSSL